MRLKFLWEGEQLDEQEFDEGAVRACRAEFTVAIPPMFEIEADDVREMLSIVDGAGLHYSTKLKHLDTKMKNDRGERGATVTRTVSGLIGPPHPQA